MSRWAPMPSTLLRDASARGLSAFVRLVLVDVVAGGQVTSLPGLLVYSSGLAAEELAATPRGVEKAVEELVEAGLLVHDRRHRTVWSVVAAEANLNGARNPAQVRGWKRYWTTIPECAPKRAAREWLFAELARKGAKFAEEFAEFAGSNGETVSQTVSETVSDTVQGTALTRTRTRTETRTRTGTPPAPTTGTGPESSSIQEPSPDVGPIEQIHRDPKTGAIAYSTEVDPKGRLNGLDLQTATDEQLCVIALRRVHMLRSDEVTLLREARLLAAHAATKSLGKREICEHVAEAVNKLARKLPEAAHEGKPFKPSAVYAFVARVAKRLFDEEREAG